MGGLNVFFPVLLRPTRGRCRVRRGGPASGGLDARPNVAERARQEGHRAKRRGVGGRRSKSPGAQRGSLLSPGPCSSLRPAEREGAEARETGEPQRAGATTSRDRATTTRRSGA